MSEFTDSLMRLMTDYGVKAQLPVSEPDLDAIGPVPGELIDLYSVTNGVSYDWFRILPTFDAENVKRTWDSIQRANDVQTTVYLKWDSKLLERFVVFADIGHRNCAVIDRNDFSVWYEEDDLHQTDLTLLEFMETEFKEVQAGF